MDVGIKLKREDLVPRISAQLNAVIDRVEEDNAQNLTDMNRYLEDVFCFLLNFVEGSSEYKNINRINGRQKPAVDLADDGRKKCYQITSETTPKKIREAIVTFESDKHKLYEDYNAFHFLLLARKKPRKKEIEAIKTNGKYAFAYDHIEDINDFIDRVNGLEAVALERISTFLDAEIVKYDYDDLYSLKDVEVLEEVIEYALQAADQQPTTLVDDGKLIGINEKIVLNFKDENERQSVRDIHERVFAKTDLIDSNLSVKKAEDIDAIQQCIHDVYNELKAKNKEPFEILIDMFKLFIPKDKTTDPHYRLAVKAFVLYFFDDCTIFEKTEAQKQQSMFGKVL